MPYYYPTRQQAQEAGESKFGSHWFVGAELEPYNGWVIVLRPRGVEVLQNVDLHAILEEAEIEITRLRKAPETRQRVEPLAVRAARAPGEVGAAPTSGSTGRVHSIAQELVDKGEVHGRADRNKVIDACIAAGINKATAGTQWAKFAKLKGW